MSRTDDRARADALVSGWGSEWSPTWPKTLNELVCDMIAEVRAESRAEALEEAAKVCDEKADKPFPGCHELDAEEAFSHAAMSIRALKETP